MNRHLKRITPEGSQFMNKIKWLYKLAVTRSFIVFTDDEAVMSILMPRNPKQLLQFTLQREMLEKYHKALGKAIEDTDKQIEKLLGEPVGKPKKKPSKAKKPTTKKS